MKAEEVQRMRTHAAWWRVERGCGTVRHSVLEGGAVAETAGGAASVHVPQVEAD